jgi:ferric-dicitrate binding protein FerR (iron transport regulator)
MSQMEQQDRLMDVLLAELLGGEAPPDLTAQLLARAFPNSAAKISQRRVWGRAWYAAAAVLLLGIGVWLGIYAFGGMNYPAPTLGGDGAVVDGGTLRRGAEVASGDNPALLTLGGYCNVELAPQTRVRIEGARKAESVYLVDGQVACDVKHNVGAFSVDTEAGTVRVTGTRFRCTVADAAEALPSLQGDRSMVSRQLMVAVLSGAVTVSGSWGQTTVAAGHDQVFPPRAKMLAADANKITGVLAEVGNSQLVLKRSNGNVTINVTGSTVFTVNNQTGAVGDLKAGMYILAITTDGQTATEIKAYSPKPKTTTTPETPKAPDPNKPYGEISQVGGGQLTLKSSGKTFIVTLTDSTTYTINTKPGNAADLKVGMHALAITADGKTATEVKAYTPKTTQPAATPNPNNIEGNVTQVGGGQLTLQNSKRTVTVTLTDSTTYAINGKAGTAADLKVGMRGVAFTSDGKTATQVKAYAPKAPTTQPPSTANPNNLYGTVTQVGGGQLTLQNPNKTATVTLTDSTTYIINKEPGTVADLQVGMHAYAITSDGKTATKVTAYTPKPAQ